MADVTPWWECLSLRPEIVAADGNINDVQMSLHAVVHQTGKVPYGDVGYYSEITHPTDGLLELMGAIAVRLASDDAADAVKPVWRGDQGMGGGKSHAEVGLWHMANDPQDFFATPLGKAVTDRVTSITPSGVPSDLSSPRVVALPCDRMDPFQPDKNLDNIAETLGERWLWRLFRGDLNRFNEYKNNLGTPDGIAAAITAAGGRVLTLVDEILSYVRKATSRAEETDRAQQDIAFLRDLMEATTNIADNSALVLVMIASDDDSVAMGEFGERCREELEDLCDRYGRSISTTTGGDFADIIRKRLFQQTPPGEVVAATASAYSNAMNDNWRDVHADFAWWNHGWAKSVERTYPFHPALLDMVESEWSNRAGFQRVRSTIQIFAATANAWSKRTKAGEWAPLLIGLGDLPLSDLKVRESMLDSGVVEDAKTIASRREIAANDVVSSTGDGGHARQVDLERQPTLDDPNPRLAERLGTALWVGSLAPRAQGQVGVTDNELAVAGFVPDPSLDLADVQAVVAEFDSPKGMATIDKIPGKGGQPRRYQLSTRSTLRMFFRAQRSGVDNDDIDQRLRTTTQAAVDKAKPGPFDTVAFISAGHIDRDAQGQEFADALSSALATGVTDEASTRLYVLDPSRFTLLNGVDSETRAAVSAALGLPKPNEWDAGFWPKSHDVVYAASCQFAVVNTQRRKTAVGSAADLIAWERVAALSAVSGDEAMAEEVAGNVAASADKFDSHLRAAFQHVIYLGPGREAMGVRLDQDNQSALEPTTVWKRLVEADKALDKDQFDRDALDHQLKDGDYGRSIKSVRDDFYRDADRVLLHGGDADLKRALYAAITAGDVEIVTPSGEIAVPSRVSDINLTVSGNIIDKPKPQGGPTEDETGSPDETTEDEGGGFGREVRGGYSPGDGRTTTPPSGPSTHRPGPAQESQVTVTLMGSAFSDETSRHAGFRLFETLAAAIDEGRVTYAQTQLQVRVDTATAQQLRSDAEEAGAQASVTDQ